jgi:4-aminobutyrate aminotransferase-like enzyme
MSLEIMDLFAEREAERYALHARHLNEQMVRVLKTIGFDKGYRRGTGQYLYDRHGERYLDLLSGWGVFAIGRNHPAVRDTLKEVLDGDLPKGLMIGVEFGAPRSLKLTASWNLLETASSGLFCQLIVIPLLKEHKLLTQVAGHGNHTIKLLPPLIISDADCGWIERSFEAVISDARRVPGAVWTLGKTLVENAVRARAAG